MSYFKIILTLLISFQTASSLMGMDVYSNPYFEPELQKTLSLLMAKNNDPQSIDLDKDTLLVIAKNNYDLYYDELLKSKIIRFGGCLFKEFWEKQLNKINDKKRIDECYGQEIKINDFDFITMNDHGRNIFLTALSVCQGDHQYGDLSEHIYKFNQETKNDYKCKIEKSFLSDHDEYQTILQLPLRLRSKLGHLLHMSIMKEQFSYENAFMEYGLCEGFMAMNLVGILGIYIALINLNQYVTTVTCACICGIGSYHIQKKYETFPVPTMLFQYFTKTHLFTNKQIRERVLKRNYSLIQQPLVPEKYAETLVLKKQTEQEFQRSKDYMIQHHKKNTHKLLTQE